MLGDFGFCPLFFYHLCQFDDVNPVLLRGFQLPVLVPRCLLDGVGLQWRMHSMIYLKAMLAFTNPSTDQKNPLVEELLGLDILQV